MINLLDNQSNTSSKFRGKNQIEKSDQSRGTNNTNSDIRFKTAILKSGLCHYSSNAFIFVKGRMANPGAGDNAGERRADERNKGVTLRTCALFKSEMRNIEIDDPKNIDIVMLMYNLIEYSDNYSKTTGRLW